MNRKSKILNNADLRRGIQRVTKPVPEREVRVNVAADGIERSLVIIALEIAVLQRASRSLENLVKSKSSANMERRAERYDVEVSSAARAALVSPGSEIREGSMGADASRTAVSSIAQAEMR